MAIRKVYLKVRGRKYKGFRNIRRGKLMPVGMQRSAISVKQPIQYFKRNVWLPNWLVTAAGVDNFTSLKFSLSQIPNHSEFTALYDQYKICMVKAELIPQFDNANVGSSTSTNVITQNYSVLDYDDIGTPTSMDQLMQYQNCKRTPSTRILKRVIKPRFASELFNTGIASAYRPTRGFVDCNYDTVEHYGMKFGFASNPQAQKYGLKMTFYLAFKNVR